MIFCYILISAPVVLNSKGKHKASCGSISCAFPHQLPCFYTFWGVNGLSPAVSVICLVWFSG